MNFDLNPRYNKIMKNLTTEQMSHVTVAYHFALAAAGGSVDGVESNIKTQKRGGLSRIVCLQNAHKEARLAGLTHSRPYFLSDSGYLAREILKLALDRGCDAFTGRTPAPEGVFTGIETSPASFGRRIMIECPEDLAPESELVPSSPHRCKDGGGFCTICGS